MAQQFYGGGVAADNGQGVRDAGRVLNETGNTFANIAQQLTARKNLAVLAAEQSRKDFYDTATQLGIPPQAYASTEAGAAQYAQMIDAQNKAINAGKLLSGFGKPEGYQDPAKSAQQYADFNGLTPEAIGYMTSADQIRQLAANTQGPAQAPAQQQQGPVLPDNYNEQWAQQAGKPTSGPVQPSVAGAPTQGQSQIPAPAQAQVPPKQATVDMEKYRADQAKLNAPFELAKSVLIQPVETGTMGITQEVINPLTGKSQYYKNAEDAATGVASIMNSNQFRQLPDSAKAALFSRYQAASQQVQPTPEGRWTFTVNGQVQRADTKAKAIKALADNPKFQPPQAQQGVQAPVVGATPGTQGVNNAPQTLQGAPAQPKTSRGGQIPDATVDAQFRQAFNQYAATNPSMKRVAQKYSGGMTSTEIWNHAPETFKSQWISQNGTLPPGVTLGNSPRADAVIEHNFTRANATAELAVQKAEPVKTALESGTLPNPKDSLSFKNALAQCGGNYAQALRAVPESTRKAVSSAVMDKFMSMDSVQAELAGMHEVASRRETQVNQGIDIERNRLQSRALDIQAQDLLMKYQMAEMEAMAKLSTSKFDMLGKTFSLLEEMDKSYTDKATVFLKQYDGDSVKMFEKNPDLLEEKNLLTTMKKTFLESAGFDTKSMDFSKISVNPGWGVFKWGKGIETTPIATVQQNEALTRARTDNAKTSIEVSSSNLGKVLDKIQ